MTFSAFSINLGESASGVFRVDEREELVTQMAFALHDAKNMACALQAGLDWLQVAHATRTHTEVGAAVAEMGQMVGQLSRILLGALASARSGSSNLAAELGRVEIGTLARAAQNRLRHLADVSGVRLVVEGDDPVWCDVDHGLVQRVLDNLLDNALKVSARGATIVLSYRRHADRIAISVADEGPGVSSEDQAKIFDLYVANDSEGTGVGLAFCQRVADAHGGGLSVVSGPGQGATFVLSLPAPP